MTRSEIKRSIDGMSEEERFFAAAYLQHLSRREDDTYRRLLQERMERMDAGKKYSLDQLKRIDESLENEGL